MFSGLLPYHIHALHEKFGPIVRLAPTEVSFTCVEAWVDIYGKQAGKEQLQKDPLTFLPPSTGVNGILFEFDDAEHNRIRYPSSLSLFLDFLILLSLHTPNCIVNTKIDIATQEKFRACILR